jgi:hypothetical protein
MIIFACKLICFITTVTGQEEEKREEKKKKRIKNE